MFNCGSSGSGFKASMTKPNGFQNSFLWHSSYAYLATFWGLHRSWEKIFTRAITFGTVSAWLNSSLHYHELTNILNSVDVNNATIKRPCIFFLSSFQVAVLLKVNGWEMHFVGGKRLVHGRKGLAILVMFGCTGQMMGWDTWNFYKYVLAKT